MTDPGTPTGTGSLRDPATPPQAIRSMVPFATLPDGSRACYPLITIEGARPGPTAVLTGGIHGDEFEGPGALWALADSITPEQLAGRLLIVPIANLAAFAGFSRTSPIDGQNLARIFPGDPEGTLSHRLAHALFHDVVLRADLLVDCHSGGARLSFAPAAGFYAAGDGIAPEAAAASLHLARTMGLDHMWRLPPRAGVLSFEAARRGIAVTGGEIGGRGGLIAAEAELYRHGILRILVDRGMLAPRPLPPAPRHETFLEGDWALAPVGGFIDSHVVPGQPVAEGELLATIRSPLGQTLARMVAGHHGRILGVRHACAIQPGEWATCVVREVPT